MVYDVSSADSFKSIPDWFDECLSATDSNVSIVLVGNKCDLDKEREVERGQGQKYAKENGMLFVETSAKTGVGIK